MELTTTAKTMTSREIADLVESRHADVCRTIERLANKGVIEGCAPSAYTNEQNGQQYKEYRLDKRSSLIVVAQLSPEFTARVVDRWQELEAAAQKPVELSRLEILKLAMDSEEARLKAEASVLALTAVVDRQKPAVEFVDRYVDATGLCGFREVCKLLGAGEAEFRSFLISSKVMYRLGGKLTAHQPHIDAGRFAVRTGLTDQEFAFTTTKFTPKGIDWIAGLWARWKLRSGYQSLAASSQ